MVRVALAIEVSQREGGVAAVRLETGADGATAATPPTACGDAPFLSDVAEIRIGPPDPDRDRLMPAMAEVMRRLSAAPAEIDMVIVSIGPGGFTGLRMAVASAKAMALALACRVVAVPSAAVAVRSVMEGGPGAARAGDAGSADDRGARGADDRGARGAEPMIVAMSGKGTDAWISLVEPAIARPCRILEASLLDAGGFDRLVAGCGKAAPRLIADEHLPPTLADAAARRGLARLPLRLSPRACLLEGLRRARVNEPGAIVPADELEPLYPREPEAVRLWRERGRKSATG